MKIAYLSPLPPERSGVADYSALLLPALREHVEVEVVSRRSRARATGAAVPLYHVGNDAEVHGWIVEELQRRPGVVVLHDVVLHHLVVGLTLARGDRNGYLAAVERAGGAHARKLAEEALAGGGEPPWETRPHELPLLEFVLDHATRVIVHSRHAEERVRASGYEGPVQRIAMPAWPAPPSTPAELPRPAPFVVAALGKLNAAKRVPQLLHAFARVRDRVPGALLVLGEVDSRLNLDARLEALGLERGRDVLEPGRIAERDLWALLARADVSVSLRWPTMGETSGIAVRALALGRPLVVSDVGWFSELPDEVAARVAVDEWEVDLLAAVLELLAGDERLRERMGLSARAYAEAEHSLQRAAAAYAEALAHAVDLQEVLS